ncbi:RIIA lysis inhibitor [Acinetobacter phage Acj9]|uniref:RIIA protector from prophage-induced early lysis n=1 Tax=Acinetobacter phage Acj9 TaxID=760939 RepID=E5EPD5_9CAUD|nr:RIIA lysis inhibitor [Acinetobacter phage Acj9]ADG59901.1 rIIA protector from prophage-induced early lysis [Acinetobacter phage Acj9]
MQLPVGNEVVLGNSGTTTAFTIGASAKAFQILSSGIYKHKIRAIARELVCNAVDAHMLGSDLPPFEIKAPNDLDPRFVVNDFGPGLSEKVMSEVYTQYFASTKTGTEIGGFGLGAKSPFSYTDTFTVESRYAGKCSIYNMMVVNGEPQMVKVFEGDLDEGEPTGIKVTVPVDPMDVAKWHSEINKIMRPFVPSTYSLIGMENNIDSFVNHTNYSTDWFGTASSTRGDAAGIYAIYGNIVYPISDAVDAPWLRAKHQCVYIHFPMNTLMPQPSREELQQDPQTMKALKDRVNELCERVMTQDIKYLYEFKTARSLARELLKWPGANADVLTKEGIKFFGRTAEELRGYNAYGVADFADQCVMTPGVYAYIIDKTSPQSRRITKTYRSRGARSEIVGRDLFGVNNEKVYVVINDFGKHQRLSLRALAHSTNPNHPNDGDAVIYMSAHNEHEERILAMLYEIMEGDEVVVIRTSELEDERKAIAPIPGTRNSRDYVRPKASNVERVEYNSDTKSFDVTKLFLCAAELDELNGYVIGLYRDDITAMSRDFQYVSGIQRYEINHFAKYMGIKTYYRIRPSVYKRMAKNEDIHCLFARFEEHYSMFQTYWSKEEFPCTTSKSRVLTNILAANGQLQCIHNLLGPKATKEIIEHINAFQCLERMHSTNKKFIKHRVEHGRKLAYAEQVFGENIESMKEKYPSIYYILNDCRNVSDELRKDIIKIFKSLTQD